ncbi:MAG: aminopeptidase [Burkholderiales bacterium]|nr:aminopeptidase [Burkholderiales bacterium]
MAGLGLAGAALLALGAMCLGTGCGELGYYRQSVAGHLDLMAKAKPVDDWLADAQAPDALKQRLTQSKQIRAFSVQVLKLPDNPSYRAYADLQRPAAVWNVVAAPALSLQLKTWCYPVTGCVGYRGYFDKAQAEALGAQLRAEGWDVSVYGVPAYSTLGWTNWLGGDPLLNTFIGQSDAELARLVFHELAHQKLYVEDDTMFNESFATAVERIGVRLWLQQHGDEAAREHYRQGQQRRLDFRELTLRYRERLAQLYAGPLPEADKLAAKGVLLAELRAEYAAIKQQRWGGFAGYDAWFASVDNASLGVLAAYTGLADDFERLFVQQGSDFDRFYARVAEIAALPKAQRHDTLRATPSQRTGDLRGGNPHPS